MQNSNNLEILVGTRPTQKPLDKNLFAKDVLVLMLLVLARFLLDLDNICMVRICFIDCQKKNRNTDSVFRFLNSLLWVFFFFFFLKGVTPGLEQASFDPNPISTDSNIVEAQKHMNSKNLLLGLLMSSTNSISFS